MTPVSALCFTELDHVPVHLCSLHAVITITLTRTTRGHKAMRLDIMFFFVTLPCLLFATLLLTLLVEKGKRYVEHDSTMYFPGPSIKETTIKGASRQWCKDMYPADNSSLTSIPCPADRYRLDTGGMYKGIQWFDVASALFVTSYRAMFFSPATFPNINLWCLWSHL